MLKGQRREAGIHRCSQIGNPALKMRYVLLPLDWSLPQSAASHPGRHHGNATLARNLTAPGRCPCIDHSEKVLATGPFGTEKVGYAAMRRHVASFTDRTWAVEGSNGACRPLAQRLLADREPVVDVPAKLSIRARMFDTGHHRKTDPHDAHAGAVVAVRELVIRGADALLGLRSAAGRVSPWPVVPWATTWCATPPPWV